VNSCNVFPPPAVRVRRAFLQAFLAFSWGAKGFCASILSLDLSSQDHSVISRLIPPIVCICFDVHGVFSKSCLVFFFTPAPDVLRLRPFALILTIA